MLIIDLLHVSLRLLRYWRAFFLRTIIYILSDLNFFLGVLVFFDLYRALFLFLFDVSTISRINDSLFILLSLVGKHFLVDLSPCWRASLAGDHRYDNQSKKYGCCCEDSDAQSVIDVEGVVAALCQFNQK